MSNLELWEDEFDTVVCTGRDGILAAYAANVDDSPSFLEDIEDKINDGDYKKVTSRQTCDFYFDTSEEAQQRFNMNAIPFPALVPIEEDDEDAELSMYDWRYAFRVTMTPEAWANGYGEIGLLWCTEW